MREATPSTGRSRRQRRQDHVAAPVDAAEVARFAALAEEWWDPDGPMAPLHRLNPVRIGYLRDELARHFGRDARDAAPLTGLALLDVGCGGGLAAESLARLGADVTGIDAAEESLAVARRHAAASGLAIDYRSATAEALAAEGQQFDAVLALEVIEHVPDPAAFLGACAALTRPGGALALATLNRTAKSFLLGIVAAEYLLGWLPRGTHRWDRFVRPSEVARALRPHGLRLADLTGIAYDPLTGTWHTTPDLAVNYMAFAVKPG